VQKWLLEEIKESL